jgi:hypothetical protein
MNASVEPKEMLAGFQARITLSVLTFNTGEHNDH